MRVFVSWEFATEDIDELVAKEMKYQELIKQNPEKYPKNVIQVHMVDRNKAISIWDVDNQEQIINKLIYMMPEGKAKITPVYESAEFIKSYMATKK